MLRTTAIAAGCLAATVLLTSCGGPRPLTKAEVGDAVLTKANVGRTYTIGEKTPLTTKLGCLEQIGSFSQGKAATKPAAKKVVQYGNDSLSGLPAVRVEVRSYDTSEQARGVLKALAEQAARCTEVTIDGETSHFTMKVTNDQDKFLKGVGSQLNTSGTGEVTGAQDLKLSSGLWLTNAIKDNNLLSVTYLNFSATDQDIARAYTKAAYARLGAVVAGKKPDKGPVKLP